MNVRVEQKERSRQSILESAARLVRERGISGARVADVMSGAALTVGAFYAHFSSKQELIGESLRRTGARLRDGLFAGLEEKPAAARAEVVLKRYLSASHRDATTLGCALPAVVGEIGTTAPEYGKPLESHLEVLVKRLMPLLPAGGVVPRRLLAIGLVALMYGGLSLSRAIKGTALSDEVLLACRALGIAAVRRQRRAR